MKTIKIGLVTFIIALGVTACSQDEQIIDESDIVRISSIIDNSYMDATPQSRATIDSYTGTGNFDSGDKWGVYTLSGGNTVLTNSAYTVGETNLYWGNLGETKPVTFMAYYPYTASITDPEAYMFNAANAPIPDLLVAIPVTKSKGEDVNLRFKHVMHKLIVNLEKGKGATGDLTKAEITLHNMKSTAKVNLLTGEVDLAGASGTDSYISRMGADSWSVAPQTLTPGAEWIKVKLGTDTYTYKVPLDLTQLESGKRLVLTLALKKGG